MTITVDTAQHEQDLQHEEWLAAIAAQLAPIFENSKDGIYVYLDDRHKICNERLAHMWGYKDAAEWAAAPDFLETFVATHADRVRVSTTYHQNVHRELSAYALRYTIRRKDGHKRVVETITVPYAYDGQLFAYTFVREGKTSTSR
ncbi:MAG TPA: hypothetical protein VI814_02435 [Candidatus Limnocylindria bacterium]